MCELSRDHSIQALLYMCYVYLATNDPVNVTLGSQPNLAGNLNRNSLEYPIDMSLHTFTHDSCGSLKIKVIRAVSQ